MMNLIFNKLIRRVAKYNKKKYMKLFKNEIESTKLN